MVKNEALRVARHALDRTRSGEVLLFKIPRLFNNHTISVCVIIRSGRAQVQNIERHVNNKTSPKIAQAHHTSKQQHPDQQQNSAVHRKQQQQKKLQKTTCDKKDPIFVRVLQCETNAVLALTECCNLS